MKGQADEDRPCWLSVADTRGVPARLAEDADQAGSAVAVLAVVRSFTGPRRARTKDSAPATSTPKFGLVGHG